MLIYLANNFEERYFLIEKSNFKISHLHPITIKDLKINIIIKNRIKYISIDISKKLKVFKISISLKKHNLGSLKLKLMALQHLE